MRISQRQLNKKKIKKEKLRYSTRKLSTGLASCIIGFTFIFVAGKTMESAFSSTSYAEGLELGLGGPEPTPAPAPAPTPAPTPTPEENKDEKTAPKAEVLEVKGKNFTNSAVVNSVDNENGSKTYEKYNVQIDNDEHNGIENEKSTYSYAEPIVSNEFNKDDYSSYQNGAFNKISNNMVRIAKDNDSYKVSDKDNYTGYHMRYNLEKGAIVALNELSKATSKDSKNEATFYIGVPDVLSIDENSKKVELTNGRLGNNDIVLNGDNAKSFVLPNYDNLRKNNKVEKPSNDLKEVAKEKINDVKNTILGALGKSGDNYKLSSDAVKSYFDNGKFKIYTLKYDLGFENKLSGTKNDPKLGIGVSFNADLKDYNVPMDTLFAVVDSNNNIYSYVYEEKLREPANNKELKEYASNRIAEVESKIDSLKDKDDEDSKSELSKLENIKAIYENLAKSNVDKKEDVNKVISDANRDLDFAKARYDSKETISAERKAEENYEKAMEKAYDDLSHTPEAETRRASEETIAAERKAEGNYEKAMEKAYDAIINGKPEVKPEVKPESKPEVKPEVNTSSNSSSVSRVNRSSGMLRTYGNNSSSKTPSTEGEKAVENKSNTTDSKPVDENKPSKSVEKVVLKNENKPASKVVLQKNKIGKLVNYNHAYRVIERKVSNIREDVKNEVSNGFIDEYLKEFAKLANLSGQEKIDKAIELSKRYFQSSDKILFVNVDSKLDMNALLQVIKEKRMPVVFFDGKTVNQKMNDELTRLGVKKVFVANLNNEVQFDSIRGFNSNIDKHNLAIKDNDEFIQEIKNI